MENDQQLMARVARLERRVRVIAGSAVIVLVAGALMGQVPSRQTFRGEAFVVMDEANRVRARLEILASGPFQGQPSLTLFDQTGRATARLGISTNEGGALEVVDGDGRVVRFPGRMGTVPLTQQR